MTTILPRPVEVCRRVSPGQTSITLAYTEKQLIEYGDKRAAEERERCAKLCDEEAEYRRERARHPLPGDSGTFLQEHKAITARKLAQSIRGASNAND
jgi:hypothetical protein